MRTPPLAEIMRWIPTGAAAAEIASSLPNGLGVRAHTRTWTPESALAVAAGGASVMLETEDGWLVIHRGVGRRLVATILGRRGETRCAARARALKKHFDGVIEGVAFEPHLGLQSLAADSLGTSSPWARMRALVALERSDVVALAVYAVVLGGLSLAVPVAVQVLVNTIALGSMLQPLIVLSVLLFGVLALSGAIQVLQGYAVELIQRRFFVRIAEDFARRLPNLDLEVHDEFHGPELANRFFEVVGLQKSFSRLLIDGLGLFLQTLVGMLLLAFYHPVLLAFDAALVVALFVVLLLGWGAASSAVNESKAKYRVASWIEEVAADPVLFGRPAGNVLAARAADALTRDYLAARRNHYAKLLRQLIGGVGMQVAAMVGLLGLGGWLVMNGELTLGQLVAAELVVGAIGVGFAKAGKYFESAYDAAASVDKLGKVVDQLVRTSRPLRSQGRGPTPVLLRDASVRRSNGALTAAANATLDAGARARLEGHGGAGKSTLLEALAGLRPLHGGLVSVGDGAKPDEFREGTWLLRPDSVAAGSVLDNLRFAELDLDENEAWELLAEVNLHTRICALPDGLHTELRPGGGPLTRTEVARLALARAMAAKPSLLLIDGGLDDLGLAGEAFECLLDVVLGPDAPWTAVVVTHRPEVAERCTQSINLTDSDTQEAA